MEGEKLITANDYQDIENQLKESKKNIKNQADDISSFQISSIKEIFTTFVKCAKSNKLFTYLILFYGWLQYFTYPFAVVIGDMILLDMSRRH